MFDVLPDDFQNNIELYHYLREFYGDNLSSFLSARPEPTAVRVNTLKYNAHKFRSDLNKYGFQYRKIPFNTNGFIIENDDFKLSHTLGFFKGHFQYQGISSQIPVLVLSPKAGDTVLDMAAAPGSKSTQIAAMMENTGQLYLNDFSTARLTPLNTNVQRSGIHNAIITQTSADRIGNLFPEKFDKILLDAPCTALGGIAKSEELFIWWSQKKLKSLAARQLRMFISAFKALKIGGEVVYSTCSIAPEENEMVVQYMLDRYPMEIVSVKMDALKKYSGGLKHYKDFSFSASMAKALRIEPGAHQLEGFFIVKLRKIGRSNTMYMKRDDDREEIKTLTHNELSAELSAISTHWGINNDIWKNFRYIRSRKRIWMVNKEIVNIPKVGFVSAGLKLAEKRSSVWRLSNQSAQFFSEFITNRKMNISKIKLKELFSTGYTNLPAAENGYHALQWENGIIAVVYAENQTIRLRLPHYFSLPEII